MATRRRFGRPMQYQVGGIKSACSWSTSNVVHLLAGTWIRTQKLFIRVILLLMARHSTAPKSTCDRGRIMLSMRTHFWNESYRKWQKSLSNITSSPYRRPKYINSPVWVDKSMMVSEGDIRYSTPLCGLPQVLRSTLGASYSSCTLVQQWLDVCHLPSAALTTLALIRMPS